jgi:hypothetical protein
MKHTTFSSKTSVDFQQTTRSYMSEHRNFRNYRCDNRYSYNFAFILVRYEYVKLTTKLNPAV